MTPLIAQIADLLVEEDFNHRLVKATAPGTFPRILVDMDCEPATTTELALVSDILTAAGQADESPLPTLQILTRPDVRVLPGAFDDFLAFCAVLSEAAGYGAFALCEKTGVFFHRHHLVLQPAEADGDVLGEVLCQIQLILQMAAPILPRLAAGTLTAASALAELAEKGLEEPPLAPCPLDTPASPAAFA